MIGISVILLSLMLFVILSYILKIRYKIIVKIHTMTQRIKKHSTKFKKKHYYLILFLFIILTLLFNYISYKAMILILLITFAYIFYGLSYVSLFQEKQQDEDGTLIEYFYKVHKSITYGDFFYKLLYFCYLFIIIIFCSLMFIILPFYIIDSMLKGTFEGSLEIFGMFIYLNLLVLPPITIKLFSWHIQKRSLIINIIKNLLIIVYGFVVVYISFLNYNFNNQIKIISIFIYTVILFSNTYFTLIEIIEYYKNKINS
ncbi:hypothetical protein AST12_08345 [Staphylococcus succinus]|nr:hypothetical protein AST12_08345 [Staphylococcus succinus]